MVDTLGTMLGLGSNPRHLNLVVWPDNSLFRAATKQILLRQYKEYSFVLSLTIITLTKFIEKKKYIELEISLIGYIIEYYFYNIPFLMR